VAKKQGGKAMHVTYSNQVHILAIDDHPEVLTEIARIVHRLGYECEQARNMNEAAACIEHSIPDLIIADVNLSGHGGVACCEELRRRCDLHDVPVMFLSSMQTPDIIRRADNCGGAYYLRKPFDAPVFVELVERTRRVPTPHLTTI
jgi:CheY-like chemotaxis protein